MGKNKPYTREDFERYREEQDAKARAEQERRERDIARRSWVAAGGDPGAFEEHYEEMRSENAKAKAVKSEVQARETQRQRIRNLF